ncbi:hypothetical protein PMIN07_004208 [Paraphaeosphaeria minitans]
MAINPSTLFPVNFCYQCWSGYGCGCIFMVAEPVSQQQSMQHTPQQLTEEPGKPEKKRGRPKHSKDKVPRNRKGEGLAKKPSWARSGRPSKQQKKALGERQAFKCQIVREEQLFGLANPELYARLQELEEQARLKT